LNGAASQAGISSVPAFFFIKNNKQVGAFVGANVKQMQELIEQHK
jgi:thioredoxin-like negative regulator of GroEL